MSYNNKPKKQYPFNWRSFDFQIEGNSVPGCKRAPKGSITPTDPSAKKKGFYFNGYFNHETMDKPFSQFLSFDDMCFIVNVLRAIANAPGEDKIVRRLACKYFKDGEMKYSGVNLLIGRNENGQISFAFMNKRIPTIQFVMRSPETMEMQNKDGEPEDVREVSRMGALVLADRWKELWRLHLNDSIETDGAPSYEKPSDQSYGQNNNNDSNDVDDEPSPW